MAITDRITQAIHRRQRPRPQEELSSSAIGRQLILFQSSSAVVPYDSPSYDSGFCGNNSMGNMGYEEAVNDKAVLSRRQYGHCRSDIRGGGSGNCNGDGDGRSKSRGSRSRSSRMQDVGNDNGNSCCESSIGTSRTQDESITIPKLLTVTVQKSHPNEPVGLRLQHRQTEDSFSCLKSRSVSNSAESSPPESSDERSAAQREPQHRLLGASAAIAAAAPNGANVINNGTVTISSISPTSPFLKCTPSIQKGDEILTINGHRVKDPKRAAEMIKSVGTNNDGTLTIVASPGERMRGTVYHMVRVPTLDRNEHYGQRNLGIEFEVTNDVLVRIKSMDGNGPFLKTNLKVGDVVLSIDGTVVRTAGEARRSLFLACRQSEDSNGCSSSGGGSGDTKVVAFLTYSFWDVRNRVIQEELLDGSSKNWEVSWSQFGDANSSKRGREEQESITLQIADTTVTFCLLFEKDGTCSCPDHMAALRNLPQHQQSPTPLRKRDMVSSDEESCSDSQTQLSRNEARAALELLYTKHIQTVIDALNYRTWKQVRLLVRALSANVDGLAPEFLPLPDPSTVNASRAGKMASPKVMKPLIKKLRPKQKYHSSEDEKTRGQKKEGEKGEASPQKKNERDHSAKRANTNPALSSSDDNEEWEPEQLSLKFTQSNVAIPPMQLNPQKQGLPNVEIRGMWKIERSSSIIPDEAVRLSERTNFSVLTGLVSGDGSDSDSSSESTSSTDTSSDSNDDSSDSDSSSSSSDSKERPPRTSTQRQSQNPAKSKLSSTQLVVYNQSQPKPPPPRKTPPPKRQLIRSQMGSSRRLQIRTGSVNELYKVYPKVIGTGAFGTVRSCMNRQTKQNLAVKSILKKGNAKNATLLKNEISLMQRVNHRNVVSVVDVIEDDDYIHIVMEECKGGDLFDKVIEDGVRLEESRVGEIIGSLLDAVAYLHDLNIVHRDLKAEHIMLSTDDINSPVKIIDFGLAIIHKPQAGDGPMTAFAGSPFTVAPEVIHRKYGKECDLWSVGVITYFLLTHLMPFNAKSDAEIFKKINSGQYAYPKWAQTGISKDAKDFISRLIKVNPNDRFTAKQALAHPWILAHYQKRQAPDPVEVTGVKPSTPHKSHRENTRHHSKQHGG